MRLVLLSILFTLSLFCQEDFYASAEDFNASTDSNASTQISEGIKVLYVKYEELPKRIVDGEIFPITLRTLSTTQNYEQIKYSFSNQDGLRALNTIPYRVESGKYYYDTFYFLTTQKWARLPDIEAYVVPNPDNLYTSTTLEGEKLNVISLNPRNNFSNVIAEEFSIVEYRTTSYDNKHNIIVFVAEATRSDISSMQFENTFKQGVESVTESLQDSRITYFVVVDKKLKSFKFSYFNLSLNRFTNVKIPIIVDDDKVVTQTDLKPRDQSKERLKLIIALSVTLVLLVFIIWIRKYVYAIILIFPIAYIIYISAPSKDLCIEQGSNIYLLPVSNGTIFETTKEVIYLQQEGKTRGFLKVKLQNNKIGWVKDENICKY
jgi:hypothetical protein